MKGGSNMIAALNNITKPFNDKMYIYFDYKCIKKYTNYGMSKYMFVERIKKEFTSGKPIFIEDILILFPEFTRAYIFRLLKKAITSGELIRFSRGVYCIPKKTIIGNSTITSNMVVNSKYITDGESTFGIYSGLALLNQFSISSQIPNVVEIVTNNESTRKRTIEIDGMEYIIRKSRFEITNDNYCYYTVLQLFSELGDNTLSDFSRKNIKEYINEKQIDCNKLIKCASFFPAQVLKKLMLSGIINGTI